MALLTKAEARAAAQTRYGSLRLAESAVRSVGTPNSTQSFDIFLSHAYEDADLIAGVQALLQAQGLSVYIDWMHDPRLDRRRVTLTTANTLRRRMRQSHQLIYISTIAAPGSRWMPWELGYFDGRRPGHVGVLLIAEHSGHSFSGQEYLGLYPQIEMLQFTQGMRRLGQRTATGQRDVKAMAA